ncbi:MAG: FAD-binding protein, partial [Coriobacteriales bacterium]|nr:FAD-binding protein [Coriobacteriales bacterium]
MLDTQRDFEDIPERTLSRRSFLMGAGAAGALAATGTLGACAPKSAEEITPGGSPVAASEGVGWLGSAPEIDPASITETVDTDLLIVGAGNGGLVAAATAVELGIDFVLAEKNPAYTEDRVWIGAVNSHYTREAGLEVDPQKILFELSKYASNKVDQNVIKVWINESAAMIDWLDTVLGPVADFDTVLGPEGNWYIPPVQHIYGGQQGMPVMGGPTTMGGPSRNGALEQIVLDAGNIIHYEHRLEKLIREGNGPVTGGIFSRSDGSYLQINARNIILATGGYANNPTMIDALIPLVPACCTSNSYNPGNDGSGMKAALHVGASKDIEGTAMIFDRGAVPPGMAAGYVGEGDERAFPGPIMQFVFGSQPFLKVDLNGRRFANESTPYDFITHAAATRKNGTYIQIFDASAAEDVMRFATIGCSKIGPMILLALGEGDPSKAFAQEIELGAVVQADTIEELAEKLEIPVDAFVTTVARYNELNEKQVDEDFGKESFRLSAIDTPPYYGVTLGGALLTTIDGLTITPDMQVLDTDKNIIEGLYAVGDVSGNFFANNYPELIVGTACGRTLTFGRHAVYHSAGKSV